MLEMAGTLFMYGYDISFEMVNFTSSENGLLGNVIPDLPKYQWHYGSFLWNEPRRSVEFRNRQNLRHELLGFLIPGGAGNVHCWRNVLVLKDLSWLEDHQLNEEIVFPGAGYIAMAIEALSQIHSDSTIKHHVLVIRQVRLLNALILSPKGNAEIFTELKRQQLSETSVSNTWWSFEISSYVNEMSTMHANGIIAFETSESEIERNIKFDDTDMQPQHSQP